MGIFTKREKEPAHMETPAGQEKGASPPMTATARGGNAACAKSRS